MEPVQTPPQAQTGFVKVAYLGLHQAVPDTSQHTAKLPSRVLLTGKQGSWAEGSIEQVGKHPGNPGVGQQLVILEIERERLETRPILNACAGLCGKVDLRWM